MNGKPCSTSFMRLEKLVPQTLVYPVFALRTPHVWHYIAGFWICSPCFWWSRRWKTSWLVLCPSTKNAKLWCHLWLLRLMELKTHLLRRNGRNWPVRHSQNNPRKWPELCHPSWQGRAQLLLWHQNAPHTQTATGHWSFHSGMLAFRARKVNGINQHCHLLGTSKYTRFGRVKCQFSLPILDTLNNKKQNSAGERQRSSHWYQKTAKADEFLHVSSHPVGYPLVI